MKKYQGLIDSTNLKRQFLVELTCLFSAVLEARLKNINFHDKQQLRDLKLSEQQIALINKSASMIDKGNGMKDIVVMIDSFKRGVKRLKTNPYGADTNNLYEWTCKNGNHKLSHKGNIPNAHFRWNYGQRYTLTEEDLRKLSLFIKPLLKYIK